MTLSIIEMRLRVFPQYLEYRIDTQFRNIFFYDKYPKCVEYRETYTVCFNTWLHRNNYSNLII